VPLPSEDQLSRLNDALAGRYRLVRELGQGGMAVVYLADDLRHARQVAVKVLRAEVAELLGAERFSREIGIAARLSHPHILPLHDSGTAGSLLFYVMPWVKGQSLGEKLRREGQLKTDDAVRIIRQAAAALDHAHAQGLVHRDIKPENILLHEGEAMVADFGIAVRPTDDRSSRLTSVGMAVGTPAYMSPEQAVGESNLDPRSDVYALACVLYELLAGEPPFTGPTPQAIIAKRFTGDVPSIRRVRPLVPAAVEHAIRRAMSPMPADRFASCGEFAEALTDTTASGEREASVAVLPFHSMGTDAMSSMFADGITEDIIAQLSKIRALKVISRSSAMRFRERTDDRRDIAARLGVATLLEGTVRQAGDRVRIVAQLVDAGTEQQLWAETYDRQLTDIFQIQTDVALQIAGALKAELSRDEQRRLRAEPTQDLRAYELVLKGRHWKTRYTETGLTKAIECFEQALELDQRYALAWAALGSAYAESRTVLASGLARVAPVRAKEAAAKALSLDPGLSQAHEVLGLVRMIYDFDWEGAETAFKLALQLGPNNADAYDFYGWLCWSTGRHDEAVELVRRAGELDPLVHRSDLPSALLRAGRYSEAADVARVTIASDPGFARGYSALGWALLLQGDAEGGLAELAKSVEVSQGDSAFLAQLGQAYAMAGRTDDARAMLARLEALHVQHPVSAYSFAYVLTGLGEHDRAIDCLEQAYGEASGALFSINGSFLFAPLRGHPRFTALLRKMHLA
jgi:serine/threonine protein kinase/Flp pilus assembly protein TadD